MNVNVWIGIRKTALDVLRPLMDDPEYDGEHIIAVKIFRHMIKYRTSANHFKTARFSGKDWKMYSLTFNSREVNLNRVKEAIDYLVANYGTQVKIAGAWKWNGLQSGTNLVDGEIVGTPIYPVLATAQLLKFMPDVDGVPATVLAQVTLVQGQAHRIF